MKSKTLFPLLLAVALAGLVLWGFPRLPELERDLLQNLVNRSAQEYFDGPLRIEKVSFDRHFRIRLTGITGKLKTRREPVPLEIGSLESQDSLFLLITSKPVRFIFTGLRPQGSPRPGISGTFRIWAGKVGGFEFFADFGNSVLEDWQWLDPQNLEGATGAVKGHLTFRQTAGLEPEFNVDLEAPEPGGNVQARFFDLFLPYLPASAQGEKVRKISESRQVVRYKQASLKVRLPQSDSMKILLQIFIPAYNLKLTLNATLRADSKNAFSQITRLMGWVA